MTDSEVTGTFIKFQQIIKFSKLVTRNSQNQTAMYRRECSYSPWFCTDAVTFLRAFTFTTHCIQQRKNTNSKFHTPAHTFHNMYSTIWELNHLQV